MIRMSKLTDYGIVLLAELGARHDTAPHNARELSLRTHLPLPVVSKLLKLPMPPFWSKRNLGLEKNCEAELRSTVPGVVHGFRREGFDFCVC